jgi:PAS domain S-box-containing protein
MPAYGFRQDSDVCGIAVNQNLEILHINRTAKTFLNETKAEDKGKLSPSILGEEQILMLNQLAVLSPPDNELQYSSKINGGFYEIRLRQHRLPEGNDCIVIRIRDLNASVRVYKQLQECHYKYKTVFQNVQIGLFQTTYEGRLVTANPAFAKILGYDSVEQLKHEVSNVAVLYEKSDKRPSILDYIYKHGSISDMESDVRRRDGTVIRISGTTAGMFDSKGNLILIQGSIIDTGSYGKQEKALHLMHETLQDITDSIIVSDFEDRIIYVNKAFEQLYGYSKAQLQELAEADNGLQTLASKITFPHSVPVGENGHHHISSVVAQNGSYRGKHINYDAAGQPLRVDVSSFEMKDELGKPLAYVTISRDVSIQHEVEESLRNAKQEAEEANQLKTSIISSMSHELRTPLTGIIGFASILKDMLGDQDDEMLAFVENIHESGKRLLETLNTILMVSDIESRRVKRNFEYIPIRPLVEDIVNRSREESGELKLDVRITESVPEKPESNEMLSAYADEHLLRQCVYNIYKNALKFTEDGSVSISIGQSEQHQVFIRINDTGIGMPPDKLKSIFSPFTQLSAGISRKYQGTGLGLYVCKSYMKLLGGSIEVESEKGTGSCFTLYLPGHGRAETADS